jgi:hypothetical protein
MKHRSSLWQDLYHRTGQVEAGWFRPCSFPKKSPVTVLTRHAPPGAQDDTHDEDRLEPAR